MSDDVLDRLNEAYDMWRLGVGGRATVDSDLLVDAAAEIESLRERLAAEMEVGSA